MRILICWLLLLWQVPAQSQYVVLPQEFETNCGNNWQSPGRWWFFSPDVRIYHESVPEGTYVAAGFRQDEVPYYRPPVDYADITIQALPGQSRAALDVNWTTDYVDQSSWPVLFQGPISFSAHVPTNSLIAVAAPHTLRDYMVPFQAPVHLHGGVAWLMHWQPANTNLVLRVDTHQNVAVVSGQDTPNVLGPRTWDHGLTCPNNVGVQTPTLANNYDHGLCHLLYHIQVLTGEEIAAVWLVGGLVMPPYRLDQCDIYIDPGNHVALMGFGWLSLDFPATVAPLTLWAQHVRFRANGSTYTSIPYGMRTPPWHPHGFGADSNMAGNGRPTAGWQGFPIVVAIRRL